MRIVVLDGYATNPDKAEWQPLHDLGECTIYDRTSPDDVITRTKNAEFILTSKVVIDESLMNALPPLRYIGVMPTVYNVVDTEAAKKRNIPVTNVPAYSTKAV